jgi:adenylate cyclase
MFVVDTFHGLADYLLGNYETAADWSRKSIRQNPKFMYSHFNLVAACGQLGQLDETGEALTAAGRLQPDISEEFFRSAWALTDPADMDHFLEGLRKAGVLES